MAQRDTSDDVAMTKDQLREYMKKHNFTVESLAERLGMTNQGVKHWLSGAREIPEPIGRMFNLMDLYPEMWSKF
jgi:transcriptional regulator with XRE-family HTH domain